MQRAIGILGFEGVNALDMSGPMEVFAQASIVADKTAPRYRLHVIGLDMRLFRAESGLAIAPECTLTNAPPLDTLIVPGGAGLREPAVNAVVAGWLRSHAPHIRRVAAVCTGIYGLAPTGLLDGRKVTTHWRFAADIAQRFPSLQVDDNAIFIRSGHYCTSAGITAGIDLALALVEEDLGPHVALGVARDLVVYLKRPGGQEQYSEPLRYQARSGDQFADLAAWIDGHLNEDCAVEALASRVNLGPRHFGRRFRDAFGCTPAAYVENARLNEARRRLGSHHHSVERIAASVGFRSGDVMRRAFERRFGLSLLEYRERFGLATVHQSFTPTEA